LQLNTIVAMMPRYFCIAIISLFMHAPAVGMRLIRPSEEVKATPGVFTLGDSYSAGVGIHTSADDYEGGACWREPHLTTGALLAADIGLPFFNYACSGDQLPEIHKQWEVVKDTHPDCVETGFAGSTIVFTIGGNDLKSNKKKSWPDILKNCIFSLHRRCHEWEENHVSNFDDVQARAKEFYTKLAQEAPNARIRVLGYPHVLMREWTCIGMPTLNWFAADWADSQVDELNRRLRHAVDEVRSIFAPSALAQKTGEAGSHSLEEELRQRATEKLNGAVAANDLETSLSRKGPAPTPPPPPPSPPPSSVDIEFVDVSRYFSRGACKLFRKEINNFEFDLGTHDIDASAHPTQRGYEKYYEALANNLGIVPSAMDDLPDNKSLQQVEEGWDTNKDGKLDISECLAMATLGAEEISPEIEAQGRAFFHQADKNQDDCLNLAEFKEFATLVEEAEEAKLSTTTTTLPPVIVGAVSRTGGRSPPAGYLPEDTNKGFGFHTKYVYVKARLQHSAWGCSGFEFRRHWGYKQYTRGTGDLADGALGYYRYIVPVGNVTPASAVKRVWWQEGKGNNKGNCTGDINKGRRGRYLFFCWSN